MAEQTDNTFMKWLFDPDADPDVFAPANDGAFDRPPQPPPTPEEKPRPKEPDVIREVAHRR